MKDLDLIYGLPWDDIGVYAQKYGLEEKDIAACILTESIGNQYCARYEPGWKYTYFPRGFSTNLNLSIETEEVLQKTSYGLMQIMGSVARELGFQGHLPILYEIHQNLDYGCMKLKKFLEKYGKIKDAIAAYNAGSVRMVNGFYENQRHVDRFDDWRRKLD